MPRDSRGAVPSSRGSSDHLDLPPKRAEAGALIERRAPGDRGAGVKPEPLIGATTPLQRAVHQEAAGTGADQFWQ